MLISYPKWTDIKRTTESYKEFKCISFFSFASCLIFFPLPVRSQLVAGGRWKLLGETGHKKVSSAPPKYLKEKCVQSSSLLQQIACTKRCNIYNEFEWCLFLVFQVWLLLIPCRQIVVHVSNLHANYRESQSASIQNNHKEVIGGTAFLQVRPPLCNRSWPPSIAPIPARE